MFDENICYIKEISESKSLIVGIMHDNVYTLDCTNANDDNIKCLTAVENNSWLWHRCLGHAHMKLPSKLSKKELVVGLPKLGFAKDKLCGACQL